MLRVPQDCLEQTLRYLQAALPREGVGLWVGKEGLVRQVWPLENVHPMPQNRYEADPQTVLELLRRIEREGLELLAIYHSHPTGPARPSESDRSQAFWRVPYVIFDMQTSEARAYRLPEGEEVAIQLEGAVGYTENSCVNSTKTIESNHKCTCHSEEALADEESGTAQGW